MQLHLFSLAVGVFASTQLDSQQPKITSQGVQHVRNPGVESNARLARRDFSYQKNCMGHFGKWEHDGLWNNFHSAVESFWNPQDQKVTVAAYISGNFVTACVRVRCSACPNPLVARELAYQAWSFSAQNKCDQNETQDHNLAQCRCHLDYAWGSSCPSAGIYWE